MKPYFLGIDIGTSRVKAGLLDREGTLLGGHSISVPSEFDSDGRARQSADTLIDLVRRVIPRACEAAGVAPGEVAALGVDGQMGGVIGVDDRFQPVTGMDMGLDLAAERLNEEAHREFGDRLLAVSCGSPRNTPKILWWKRSHPEVYRRVRRFTTIGGYVIGTLSGFAGDEACIDETLIAYFGNEDARERRWSEELTRAWGIDDDKLPLIHRPTDLIGAITRDAAGATGLLDGTPIVAGAGDQPAGYLGGGFEEIGTVIDVGGSTTMLSMCVDEVRPDPSGGTVMFIPAVSDGMYYVTWYINGGGMVIPWFADLLGSPDILKELEEPVRAIAPGSDGLLFGPYFGGRQCPYTRTMRGAFVGLNWGHRRAHMLRAIFESIAAEYSRGYESFSRLYPGVGNAGTETMGGATANRALLEIKAELLGRPLMVHRDFDASVRGSALLAGIGVGAFDLDAIPEPKTDVEEIRPARHRIDAYAPVRHAYRSLYEQPLDEFFARLHATD